METTSEKVCPWCLNPWPCLARCTLTLTRPERAVYITQDIGGIVAIYPEAFMVVQRAR